MTTNCVVDASSFLKACAENTVTAFPKKKMTHVGLTFCLKTFFKWLQCVLMRRPQGLGPGLYVVQNCWPSDLLLIVVMIVL